MADITIDQTTGYRITLDLTQAEAAEVLQSVYEAASYVDNWRSNPINVFRLCEQLAAKMGLKWQPPPAHEPWHDVINRAARGL